MHSTRPLDIWITPPMVAVLIGIGNFVFGQTEFAVRAGALISWLFTATFTFKLTRLCFDTSAAYQSLLLTAILPAYFCTGFLMTPDTPLIASWAACLYFLSQAFVKGRANAWLAFGTSLGIGLLSKYTIALLGPAVIVFLLLDPDSRKWFIKPQPYLAAGIVFIIFSPVIWWNLEHDWASFAFQGPRRFLDDFDFSLPELVGSVLLLLTPTGFLDLCGCLVGAQHAAP